MLFRRVADLGRRVADLERRLADLERRDVSYDMPAAPTVELSAGARLDVGDPPAVPSVSVADEDDELRRWRCGVYL